MNAERGTITLIGSGELGESLAKVYRRLLAGIQPPVKAVFVDTPAGFQVNADEISAKAVEYFKQRLDLTLEIATFRSKNRASARQVEAALHALYHANFIFAGPGSPTYAIRNWRGSTVWDTIAARVNAGADLVLASAAAIAVSSCALPVYEIYKAGGDVDWVDGLDLLGRFGLKLTIVPHWNNAEGGTYDTRFCYMGQARLKELEARLSFDVVLLGIDEHTAITLDLNTQQGRVDGAGRVVVRYNGREWTFPAGTVISFDQLRAANLRAPRPMLNADVSTAPSSRSVTTAASAQILTTTHYLDQIARAMEETGEPKAQRELIDHAHETMHELAAAWQGADRRAPSDDISPLVEVLISPRAQLRAAKQFALADQLRARLGELGIVLEDTPAGTRWKKTSRKEPQANEPRE